MERFTMSTQRRRKCCASRHQLCAGGDRIAGQRPDYYIAISQHVKVRIEKYYGRNVEAVIYPPVETEKIPTENGKRGLFSCCIAACSI